MISDETGEFSEATGPVSVPSALYNVEGRIRGILPQTRWKRTNHTNVVSNLNTCPIARTHLCSRTNPYNYKMSCGTNSPAVFHGRHPTELLGLLTHFGWDHVGLALWVTGFSSSLVSSNFYMHYLPLPRRHQSPDGQTHTVLGN